MNILIAGASGLVGKALVPALQAGGNQVQRLVRKRAATVPGDLPWDPAAGQIDLATVEVADAIVNLAGESIAAGRWSEKRKVAIHDSRVHSTRTLAQALARVATRPRTLINASAIGFYGDRGDEVLDENSSPGQGDFLSGVCRDWEAETAAASSAGARVVLARFGVILSGKGGALKKMLLPFKLGLGGKIGNGRQFMSWVALDDVVGAIQFCLAAEGMVGPVNVVAPDPVTNQEFTKTLGRVLHRPTLFPMPAFAARAAFGQMGDELLLASQRVRPARLLAAGYRFAYPELAGALQHVLSAG